MIEYIDSERYSEVMNGFADAVAGAGMNNTAQQLVAGEAAQLMVTIMKFTPPMGPGGKAAGSREAGENAVERDLNILVDEASPHLIYEVGQQHGFSGIDAWFTTHEGNRMHLEWGLLNPSGGRIMDVHSNPANRTKRGKVLKLPRTSRNVWRSRIVVEQGNLDPAIVNLKKRVGRWKASIGLALVYLGKTVPEWIRRHFSGISDIAIIDMSKINDPKEPTIQFGSRAPGIAEPEFNYTPQVQAAVKARTQALVTKTNLILAGKIKEINSGNVPRRFTISQEQLVIE